MSEQPERHRGRMEEHGAIIPGGPVRPLGAANLRAYIPGVTPELMLVEELVEYGRTLGLSREKARAVISGVSPGRNRRDDARTALIEASFAKDEESDA